MGKLSSLSQGADDDTGALSIIFLSAICAMLSLVISFMGIKLRWFRHRLTLEQPPNPVVSPVLMRTTSVTEFRENCARGVYRQSLDDESLILSEKPSVPTTNVKAKTKSSDRQSIFRLPFKSKLSLSKQSSRDDSKISAVHQPTRAPVHYSPNRGHDEATSLQKNEHLRQLIHEKLNPQNSMSMPNLRQASPTGYRERSVDDYVVEDPEPEESPRGVKSGSFEKVSEGFKAYEVTAENHATPSTSSVNGVDQEDTAYTVTFEDETIRKRVKFEEVHEIEEVIFEAQVDNHFGAASTPSPIDFQYDLPPPTPMKRKSRENSFEVKNEVQQTAENGEAPVVKPRTRRLVHRTSDASRKDDMLENDDSPTVNFTKNDAPAVNHTRNDLPSVSHTRNDAIEKDERDLEEDQPKAQPKAQSKAHQNGFEKLPVRVYEEAMEKAFEDSAEKAPHEASEQSSQKAQKAYQGADEKVLEEALEKTSNKAPEQTSPKADDKTQNDQNATQNGAFEMVSKKALERAHNGAFESTSKSSSEDAIQKAQAVAKTEASDKVSENVTSEAFPKVSKESFEKVGDDSFKNAPEKASTDPIVVEIDIEDQPYKIIEQPVEIQVVPKSILKSSEAAESSNGPKTLTFHNVPETISADESSSSESSEDELEEEDVWSRVNAHRFLLKRNQPDVLPPLPKTPPPSEDEERQFSFA